MRRLAPRPLAVALRGVTGAMAPATTLARVQGAWPQVAGAALAEEAEPVSERDGVLSLRCRSAVWAQELELLGPELVGRLNEAVPGAGLTAIRTSSGRS